MRKTMPSGESELNIKRLLALSYGALYGCKHEDITTPKRKGNVSLNSLFNVGLDIPKR